MSDTIANTKEDFSFDELNNCIRPLLVKLSNNAPSKSDCRLGKSEIDGDFLRITSKNNETLYKVLGSEYHGEQKIVYLNIVKQASHYHAGWQGMMVSRIEVACDGSINDLEAQLMKQYDKVNKLLHELYND